MSFAHVKDPPLQKMNAHELAITLQMHKLGAKPTVSRSTKNF